MRGVTRRESSDTPAGPGRPWIVSRKDLNAGLVVRARSTYVNTGLISLLADHIKVLYIWSMIFPVHKCTADMEIISDVEEI